MSHSIGSAPSSLGSNGSKRFTRRYRTVNTKSVVDENLFGTPQRITQAQEMRDKKSGSAANLREQPNFNASSDRNQGQRKPQYIKHITKDLIREILVPEDQGQKSLVIDGETYGRLLKACNYKSKSELEDEKQRANDEQDRIVNEIHERKKIIQKYDMDRKKNEQLDEIDELAKEDAEYLLKKANEQRQEQEDEIKRLNELILNVKVHAIRDAQLVEKQQIKREVKDEEKRLDMMMEVDRLNAIKVQEEIEAKRKSDQQTGAKMILKQIEMNRQEKLIQEEVREQENAMMLTHLEKLQKEDYEEVRKRKEKQKALASDLIIANRDLEKQKEFRKQQDIVAELKVLEYQRDKAARDSAYEAEQEKKRQDREKEIARLRAKQERARDMQADKDALRAKREQERKEREWREKERLEAMKKRQIEEEMKLSREWQCRNKEHYLAVEAAKDRSEFQKVLKAQIELADKDKQKEDEMHRDRKHYSENLQRQIRENELVRIKERKAFFEEGVKLDDEAKARRAKLDDIKKKKLNELRNAGIPDKYCAEIERKLAVH